MKAQKKCASGQVRPRKGRSFLFCGTVPCSVTVLYILNKDAWSRCVSDQASCLNLMASIYHVSITTLTKGNSVLSQVSFEIAGFEKDPPNRAYIMYIRFSWSMRNKFERIPNFKRLYCNYAHPFSSSCSAAASSSPNPLTNQNSTCGFNRSRSRYRDLFSDQIHGVLPRRKRSESDQD